MIKVFKNVIQGYFKWWTCFSDRWIHHLLFWTPFSPCILKTSLIFLKPNNKLHASPKTTIYYLYSRYNKHMSEWSMHKQLAKQAGHFGRINRNISYVSLSSKASLSSTSKGLLGNFWLIQNRNKMYRIWYFTMLDQIKKKILKASFQNSYLSNLKKYNTITRMKTVFKI